MKQIQEINHTKISFFENPERRIKTTKLIVSQLDEIINTPMEGWNLKFVLPRIAQAQNHQIVSAKQMKDSLHSMVNLIELLALKDGEAEEDLVGVDSGEFDSVTVKKIASSLVALMSFPSHRKEISQTTEVLGEKLKTLFSIEKITELLSQSRISGQSKLEIIERIIVSIEEMMCVGNQIEQDQSIQTFKKAFDTNYLNDGMSFEDYQKSCDKLDIGPRFEQSSDRKLELLWFLYSEKKKLLALTNSNEFNGEVPEDGEPEH